MTEPRDIPELMDPDRHPDRVTFDASDFPRPFGAAKQRLSDSMQALNTSMLGLQDAFYRGQRLGLEQAVGHGWRGILVGLVFGFAGGVILGLLLPW